MSEMASAMTPLGSATSALGAASSSVDHTVTTTAGAGRKSSPARVIAARAWFEPS